VAGRRGIEQRTGAYGQGGRLLRAQADPEPHWNGTSWAVVPSPSPGPLFNILTGAAIVSAGDIWAVGSSQNTSGISQTLIEIWNGTSWSAVASPSPGSAASLGGAAADPVSGQAWAVGNFTAASGAQQTLTEFNP
jgi:hypothetical protein